jgi:serine/threonine protein kinase
MENDRAVFDKTTNSNMFKKTVFTRLMLDSFIYPLKDWEPCGANVFVNLQKNIVWKISDIYKDNEADIQTFLSKHTEHVPPVYFYGANNTILNKLYKKLCKKYGLPCFKKVESHFFTKYINGMQLDAFWGEKIDPYPYVTVHNQTPQDLKNKRIEINAKLMKILRVLHELRICHNDLHDGNIIIENGTDKMYIIDFGCSTFLPEGKEISFEDYVQRQYSSWGNCGYLGNILRERRKGLGRSRRFDSTRRRRSRKR